MSKNKRRRKFEFRIDAFSVDTMPMRRLADYVSDLATAIGEEENVHLHSIESGSVILDMRIDPDAEPRVRERIRDIKNNNISSTVRVAVERLNKKLKEDRASAVLSDNRHRNILSFPDVFQLELLGPIKQNGSIDGIPIRVGGKFESVPVHIESLDKEVQICQARRELAKEIASHIFQDVIRVEGVGSWYRLPSGRWEIQSFQIHDYRVIGDIDLDTSIHKLQAIEFDFPENPDIDEVLGEIRSGQ